MLIRATAPGRMNLTCTILAVTSSFPTFQKGAQFQDVVVLTHLPVLPFRRDVFVPRAACPGDGLLFCWRFAIDLQRQLCVKMGLFSFSLFWPNLGLLPGLAQHLPLRPGLHSAGGTCRRSPSFFVLWPLAFVVLLLLLLLIPLLPPPALTLLLLLLLVLLRCAPDSKPVSSGIC